MKNFLILVFLTFNVSLYAQPYIGTSIMNKGFGGTIGILAADRFDVTFNFQNPFNNVLNPTMISLSMGYMINISKKVTDNYTITPSFGIATSKFKEIIPANTRINNYEDPVPYEFLKTRRTSNAYYNIELGKDAYMGRVFIKSTYVAKNLYYGIGMRVFFTRNN